jgi:hypothetical protein
LLMCFIRVVCACVCTHVFFSRVRVCASLRDARVGVLPACCVCVVADVRACANHHVLALVFVHLRGCCLCKFACMCADFMCACLHELLCLAMVCCVCFLCTA